MRISIKTFKTSTLLCLVLLLISACSEKPGCHIKGTCSDSNYQTVRLIDLDDKEIATTTVSGKEFSFSLDQEIIQPYMAEVILVNRDDSEDFVTIPVGIENGTIKILYGASFKIKGTPLNEKVQAFISGMSRLRDEVTSPDRTIPVSEIAGEFSHYYCRSITLNYDNPLGAYIFERYGSHLTDEDRAQAEQSLKK